MRLLVLLEVAAALLRRAPDNAAAALVAAEVVTTRHAELDQRQLPGGEEVPWYAKLDFLLPGIYVCLAVLVVGVVAFEAYERWCGRRRAEETVPEPNAKDQEQTLDLRRILDGIPRFITPYFQNKAVGKAYVAVVLLLGLIALFLKFVYNSWQLEFWNLFQEGPGQSLLHADGARHFLHSGGASKFTWLMGVFTALLCCFVLADVYSQYVRLLLYIDWRQYLTDELLDAWFAKHAYYGMQLQPAGTPGKVDNPDQRVQEDVGLFIDDAIILIWEFLSSLGGLVVFLPLLLAYAPSKAFGVVYLPGWLVYLALLYSLVGSLIAHGIGGRLIPIGFAKQRAEADFRSSLVEVRENAESVVLGAGAEPRARQRLGRKFATFRGVWWHYMHATKHLAFFTRTFMLVKHLVPFFILAPSYFNGEVSLGQLFQLVHALAEVSGAFDWFISAYPLLTAWRATTDRLMAFEQACKKSAASPAPVVEDQPRFGAKGLEVRLPTGDPLWSCDKLELPPGWVLLTGPEGLGKTTLLRTLCGAWPYATGELSGPARRVVVPQHPFWPHCPLREALGGEQLADEKLQATLASVGLGQLDLAASAQWSERLSMGEQRRLALAQAVLARPDCLVLDESLSHLSESGAADIVALLKRELPQCQVVLVSHEVTRLRPHFDSCFRATVEKQQLRLERM